VLFAAAKPVGRDILARVVGRDCALDLLLDDLHGRPIELIRAGEVFTLQTSRRSAPRRASRSTSRPTRGRSPGSRRWRIASR
jgi:hypothetical protein